MAIDLRLIASAGIAPLLITAVVGAETTTVPGKGGQTIQDAIDDASDGDVIVVGPGTYPERIDFGQKCVELRALAGADQTTISGASALTSVARRVDLRTTSAPRPFDGSEASQVTRETRARPPSTPLQMA